jgi:hypothetical protein
MFCLFSTVSTPKACLSKATVLFEYGSPKGLASEKRELDPTATTVLDAIFVAFGRYFLERPFQHIGRQEIVRDEMLPRFAVQNCHVDAFSAKSRQVTCATCAPNPPVKQAFYSS